MAHGVKARQGDREHIPSSEATGANGAVCEISPGE